MALLPWLDPTALDPTALAVLTVLVAVTEIAMVVAANVYALESIYMDPPGYGLAAHVRRRAWRVPAAMVVLSLFNNLAFAMPATFVLGVALGQLGSLLGWLGWLVYKLARRVDESDRHVDELKRDLEAARPRKLAEPRWFKPEVGP